MAKQTIGVGTVADDLTGDTIRAGGIKINDNFDELYGMSGDVTLAGAAVATIANNAVTYTKSYNGAQLAIINMFDTM